MLVLNFIPIIYIFTYAQQEVPTLTTSQGAPNIIKDPSLKRSQLKGGVSF